MTDMPLHGNVRLGVALIVDDEPMIRIDIAEYLRDAAFHRVMEAQNGDEALAVLEAHPEVTIVVSDIEMPGLINGLELAAWVKARRPDMKVVLMSGRVPPSSAGMAADLFLSKPIRLPSLLTNVTRLLATS